MGPREQNGTVRRYNFKSERNDKSLLLSKNDLSLKFNENLEVFAKQLIIID